MTCSSFVHRIGGRNPQARPCRHPTPSASRTCAFSIWCAPAAMPASTRRSFRTPCCCRGGPAIRALCRLSGSCGANGVEHGARPRSTWNYGPGIEHERGNMAGGYETLPPPRRRGATGLRRSVERPGGRLVRELANGVGDPAPHGLAVVIVPRGKLVGARGAFLKGLVPIPLEHEVGGAPDVDLRCHRGQAARFRSPIV